MNWIQSSGDKSISNATTDNAQKSKTAGPFLFAVGGVLLNLTGLIVQLSYGNGLQLLTLFYYIGVLIGFSRHVKKSTFDQNRMTMMAFLAIGFVYLSFDIQLSIFFLSAVNSSDSIANKQIATAGSATSLAGCLITIISWTYLMIRTGEIPSMQSLPN